MLRGIAAVPSAPLLAPGVVTHRPASTGPVVAAVEAVVGGLPDAAVAVVVTSGTAGIDASGRLDLSGLGRPRLRRRVDTPAVDVERVAAATGLPVRDDVPLEVDAACLTLWLAGRWPVVPLSVPAGEEAAALTRLGTALARGLGASGRGAVVVAASDGAAGLSRRAPLALVDGAAEWQEAFIGGVRSGRRDLLADLGPAAAARVGARGWAPMLVLHGAAAAAGMALDLCHHDVPRGVGYLVAAGP